MASEPYWAAAPSAQDLDAVERARGDGVEVDTARPRPHAVGEVVDQGRLMPPPSVDQDQGVVGTQAAEGEGADDVARVGDALPREVDRRGHRLQNDTGLGAALLGQLLGGEDVHRHGQLLGGGMAGARAHDHVDRSQLHGAAGEREVLTGLIAGHDVHLLGSGLKADQPDPDGVVPGGNTPNLVDAPARGHGAGLGAFDDHGRVGQRCPAAVRHGAAERRRLGGERGGDNDQREAPTPSDDASSHGPSGDVWIHL